MPRDLAVVEHRAWQLVVGQLAVGRTVAAVVAAVDNVGTVVADTAGGGGAAAERRGKALLAAAAEASCFVLQHQRATSDGSASLRQA